ncbi:MAG: ABC transporter permease, partial [Chitinophagaceae bacterium]
EHIQSSIDKIRKTWDQFVPSVPFSYTFLDERFAKLYTAEQRQEKIFTIFACLAIFIACLGLFGLSAFTIAQRTKEIGIRKVLGASVSQIIKMLSKDFMKLVALAAVIALPAGWICMHQWLQSFAYHVQVQWWLLVLAALVAACIALVTIGMLALRAAVANPVESLRTE